MKVTDRKYKLIKMYINYKRHLTALNMYPKIALIKKYIVIYTVQKLIANTQLGVMPEINVLKRRKG